jgi:hypothetical protein
MYIEEDAHCSRSPRARAQVAELLAELLDALTDTQDLARDDASDEHWRVHLAYLRDLEDLGQGVLWELVCGTPVPAG